MTLPAAAVTAVPCRQCGYDLRALPVTGRCPECGAAVAPSRAAAALDAAGLDVPLTLANLRWVGRVGRGAVLIAVTDVTWAGVELVSSLLTTTGRPPPAVETITVVTAIAATIGLAAGAWLLATGEPSARPNRAVAVARIGARYGLGLVVAALMAPLWLPAIQSTLRLRTGVWPLNGLGSIPTACALYIAADLARRDGRPRLAWAARLALVAAVGTNAAEASIGLVRIGSNMAAEAAALPLVGDLDALANLVLTERYQSRCDGTAVVLTLASAVSAGILAVWIAVALALVRAPARTVESAPDV